MATFTLTSAIDNFLGTTASDDFILTNAAHLGSLDSVGGGDGAGVDTLVVQTGMTLVASRLNVLTGFERISATAGQMSLVLTDSLANGSSLGNFTVLTGTGNDTINGGLVLTKSLLIDAGDGNDSVIGGGGNDSLIGGIGNDRLFGRLGDDTLDGGDGADRLSGAVGNDVLRGGSGNDLLSGGAGDDTLSGGTDFDSLDGGRGNDTFLFNTSDFSLGDLVVDEGGSKDTLRFSGTTALVINIGLADRITGIEEIYFAGTNDEIFISNAMMDSVQGRTLSVYGGAGNDAIRGTLADPLGKVNLYLDGGAGNDTLIGNRGEDTLVSGTGGGSFFGEAGNDTFVLRTEDLVTLPTLVGGTGTDTLRFITEGSITAALLANVSTIELMELSAAGNSVFLGDAMFPSVFATLTVIGASGDDLVSTAGVTGARAITTYLGDGDDIFIGGAANDRVYAGDGIDSINTGTGGADIVSFEAGALTALDSVVATPLSQFFNSNTLSVNLVPDTTLTSTAFAGVSGFGRFEFVTSDLTQTASVRLAANAFAQSGLVSDSFMYISLAHSEEPGTVTGGILVDARAATGTFSISGGIGHDTLLGGAASDTFFGGPGDDIMVGGLGADDIFLGTGSVNDQAHYSSLQDGSADMTTTVLNASQLYTQADKIYGLGTGSTISLSRSDFAFDTYSTYVHTAAGGTVALDEAVNVLVGADTIADDDFGSLAKVKALLDGRLSGTPGQADITVMVIGGSTGTSFGMYLFIDRDNNTTIDSADDLYLLAVGLTGIETVSSAAAFEFNDYPF